MMIPDEVKLVCTADKCVNNMVHFPNGDFYCNLKNITLDEKGCCTNYTVIVDNLRTLKK